jgi:uncharacterized RDD family membrane protein YckC
MKTIRIHPLDDRVVLTEVGSVLGHYRLIRQLGKGGMGAVFEAEEVESGRRVALKVLSHSLDSPMSRERFRREGILAAAINHPNTVYVFGTDEMDGRAFIAMELVGGGTLQDWIQPDSPMVVDAAVDAVLQVIAGLEAAAAKGVLHRDIKPSNCFLEPNGTVKVGDFGLAISVSAPSDSKLTVPGSFIGTPAYSPPEQVRGEEFTVRGDIYAVGVMLYQLLTGRTPFAEEDPVRLLATILERTPDSPARWRPGLPPGLCRVILKCLEKAPRNRFRDYAEFRNALLPYSSVAPTPATLSLRFMAGVLDGLVLFVLGISVNLISTGRWDALIHPDYHPSTRMFMALFGLSLNLIYYSIPEGRWGMSLGKWICGIRVVGSNRGNPGYWKALARSLIVEGIPVFPSVLYAVLSYIPNSASSETLTRLEAISGFSLGVAPLLFLTARRRNGFAAIHDLLTRTRVVRRVAHGTRPRLKLDEDSIVTSKLASASASHVGAYAVLKTVERWDGVETLLGLDRQLHRTVWVRKLDVGTPALDSRLQNLSRGGRLRWLNGRRSESEAWDAYEAGNGQALWDVLQRPQAWDRVRFWLLDLVEELTVSLKTQTLPEVLALDRVWITAEGRAVLLDFPVPVEGRPEAGRDPAWSSATNDPQLFLSRWAVSALQGRGAIGGEIRPSAVAVPLPPHAREILHEIEQGPFPGSLLDKIRHGFNHCARVSVGHRAAVLIGCCGVPLLACALGVVGFYVAVHLAQGQSATARLRQSLEQWETLSAAAAAPGTSNSVHLEQQAYEVYIAGQFRSTITNHEAWNDLAGALIPRERRKMAEEWVVNRPQPTAAELEQAAKVVEPFLASRQTFELKEMRVVVSKPLTVLATAAWTLTLGSALPSMMAAVLFRGGLVLRLLGLAVVRTDGRRPSRLRLLWRASVAWSPVIAFSLASLGWKPGPTGMPWLTSMEIIGGAFVFLGLMIWAGLFPSRGLHDRLAGTCLIPRE